MIVLLTIANRPPARVIAVLFAVSGVPACDLKMRLRVRRNPHIGPRWWNDELADAITCRAIDARTVRARVDKLAADSSPADAGHAVTAVAQARLANTFHRRLPMKGSGRTRVSESDDSVASVRHS